ncbi:class III lanthionine synthetase LanKC [Krasilnikovia sp. MM14-A1004]|uniref:class III lanthionine synthetase LanKC n=1 Tax=Krasilnikovia sp. MM14-A1004 TaxID=3373541 RepID=UPI00399CEF18
MIEWEHLALFCQSDPDFFAAPGQLPDSASRLDAAMREAPEGWDRSENELWVRFTPRVGVGSDTGWKIHVSVTLEEAERVCGAVWDYCVARGLPFKLLRSRRAIQLMNGKYAERAASGKTIAIYPTNDDFAAAVTDLEALLKGTPGPYILSDLRIGEGPVFVRYGAFQRMLCPGEDGEPVLARRDAADRLVPDERRPSFAVPQGIAIPEVLLPHLAARADSGDVDFPFTIEKALHYSNCGGVYLAIDEGNGERVVLVEARPHAGLDRNGRDATARLAVQRSVLERLADLPCVPRLLGFRSAWEHHYLVEEYIEGASLFDEMVQRYPYALAPSGPAEADLKAYHAWAEEMMTKLSDALDQIHSRGVRYGDLHPSNVIVRPDGQVFLIDFEYARPLDEREVIDGGAPGFYAPPEVFGAAADRAQLAWVYVWLYLPLNLRPEHTPAQVHRALATVEDLFPVDDGFTARVVGHLPAGVVTPPRDVGDELLGRTYPDWPVIRDSLVEGIMVSATIDRPGALFPGSPPQFSTGGHNFAYGSAGVLFALHQMDVEVPEAFVEWTIDSARHDRIAFPGLFDGLHGVAYVLDELGYHAEAIDMLNRARHRESTVASVGLLGGRAGIALSLLHFARRTGDSGLLADAVGIAEDLMHLAETGEETSATRAPRTGGLLKGMSGVALVLMHLYAMTDNDMYLDGARLALGWDVDRSAVLADGSRHLIDQGTRQRHVIAHIEVAADADPPDGVQDRFRATVPRLLPPVIGDFVGRVEEISFIRQVLTREAERADAVVPMVAICGPGGVGKTTLSVRVAHNLREQYPDGQLYVNLRGMDPNEPVEAFEALGRFLRALGVTGLALPDDLDQRAELYRDLLANRRVLVLLDNAAGDDQASALIPGSPTCGVIINSRRRIGATLGAAVLNLDVLDFEQSLSLLSRVVGDRRISAEPEASAALVQRCGQLPLALRIGGAKLAAKPHWNIAKIVRLLADERGRLDYLTHGNLDVRASISLSVAGLPPEAQTLLRRLGDIDLPESTVWICAALLQVEAPQAEGILEILFDAQLIDAVGRDTAGYPRYRLHDLVRLFAKESAARTESNAELAAAPGRVLATCLLIVDMAYYRAEGGPYRNIWGDTVRPTAGREAAQTLAAQPMKWFEAERHIVAALIRRAAKDGRVAECWELACTTSPMYERLRLFDEWQEVLDSALEATRQAGDERGQAAILYRLGLLWASRNDGIRASAYLENASRLFSRIGDPHGQATVSCLAAMLDRFRGDNDSAMARYEKALPVLRASGDHGGEALALRCVGQLHLAGGNLAQADVYLTSALNLYRTHNAQHGEAQALFWLSMLRIEQQRYGDAESGFQRALATCRSLGDVAGEAQCLRGMGLCLKQQGHPDQAKVILLRALDLVAQPRPTILEGFIRRSLEGLLASSSGAQ